MELPAHPPLSLLALPSELRNQIYGYVLYGGERGLQYCDRAYTQRRSPVLLAACPAEPPELGFPSRRAFNQLQYVCRQMREETSLTMQVRGNGFVLTPTGRGPTVQAFTRFKALPIALRRVVLAHAKHVTLCSIRRQRNSHLEIPETMKRLQVVADFAALHPRTHFRFYFAGVEPVRSWERLECAAFMSYALESTEELNGMHPWALARFGVERSYRQWKLHMGKSDWIRGAEGFRRKDNFKLWFEGLGFDNEADMERVAHRWADLYGSERQLDGEEMFRKLLGCWKVWCADGI